MNFCLVYFIPSKSGDFIGLQHKIKLLWCMNLVGREKPKLLVWCLSNGSCSDFYSTLRWGYFKLSVLTISPSSLLWVFFWHGLLFKDTELWSSGDVEPLGYILYNFIRSWLTGLPITSCGACKYFHLLHVVPSFGHSLTHRTNICDSRKDITSSKFKTNMLFLKWFLMLRWEQHTPFYSLLYLSNAKILNLSCEDTRSEK